MKQFKERNGFSIIELLVVIGIIGILLAMLLPNVRRVREASKRTQCLNNLRQIALATLNYESALMHFPSAKGLQEFEGVGISDRLGPHVAVAGFLESSDLYHRITTPSTFNGVQFPAMPPLNSPKYDPWTMRHPILTCPSLDSSEGTFAPTHYGFSIGDRARNIASAENLRGIYAGNLRCTFKELTDGSSNTILAGEIGAIRDGGSLANYAINRSESFLDDPSESFSLLQGNSKRLRYASHVQLATSGRGSHWADGRSGPATFNTILPPKSPSVAVGGSIDVDGIYSASGPHPGGVNVAFADGSSHFINEEIDAGDSTHPTLTEEEIAVGGPSPYGVWGALGTISGGEIAEEF